MPIPEPFLHRQARERARLLYRAEGVRFVDVALELVGAVGYVDVRVADVAAAAGIHEKNARSWLRRCHEDGILYWASKVGRGAISRLALVAESARVSRFIASVSLVKKKNLSLRFKITGANCVRATLQRQRQERYDERRREAARRMAVVRLMEDELLPELWDRDDRTGVTLARAILQAPEPITAGFVLMLRDRLTCNLPGWRWRSIDADRPAAYVYGALCNAGTGRGGWAGYYTCPDADPTGWARGQYDYDDWPPGEAPDEIAEEWAEAWHEEHPWSHELGMRVRRGSDLVGYTDAEEDL